MVRVVSPVGGFVNFIVAFIFLLVPLFLGSNARANDQDTNVEKVSYIKPSTTDDGYRMVVFGDSLAVGLWQGLHQNFRKDDDTEVEVIREAKVNSGIVRSDRFDWPKHAEKVARQKQFDIAVLMFGANDAQSIRTKGKRHHYKTPGWEEHYRARIDRMISALKDQTTAIYWVGLPNVRKDRFRDYYTHANAIFQEKAKEHNIRFIDTWSVTNDENGNFKPYGKGMDGRKALLRTRDGIHFTPEGYQVLARIPQELIRKDMPAPVPEAGVN